MTLAAQIAATKQAVAAQIQAEENLRRSQPLIRFWDAEFQLQHVGGSEIKAQFSWISNDTGPGQVTLPFDGPIAQWIHDTEGRLERGEGRNVCITVDYCGARWSGVMDKYTVEQREDGDVVLVVDFFHDYEHLKWTTIYSNPFFAPALQIPRAWVCAGPIDWALKTTLLVNLFRQHKPRATWPNDPLDRLSFDWLDQSQWPMAVHPGSFREGMESGHIWGVVTSRFGSWHDVAHILLEDAEMSVTCRRWLEGDPSPWENPDGSDYIPRNGQLIIDIVDKSGVYVGTSHGGKLTEGLKRTIVEFADDFIDSTQQLMVDAEVPVDYYKPNSKYTTPEKPYVVFREGETSPIQTSQWIHSPAKGVQILVGGHSMPGVNEIISASIQGLGDLWGNLILIGGLGGTIDTLLKPLYEDTVLAWQAIKSSERDNNSGWERLYEYFQQGATGAWTLAALMVLRAGYWATKTTVSWKCAVADGLPYLIGDNEQGHFFLDDRVGLVLTGDDQIHMDRARKLDIAWDEDSPPEWQITIGDDRLLQDPAQRALGKIEAIIAGMRDLGVYTGLVVAGVSATVALTLSLGGQPADTTNTYAVGTHISGVSGELMSAHAVGVDVATPVSTRLLASSTDLSTIQPASAAHALPVGSDVRVLGSPFMAADAVGSSTDAVGSVPDLVKSVLTLGSPGEVIQPIVGTVSI